MKRHYHENEIPPELSEWFELMTAPPTVPCVVADIFAGAGTVMLVAERLGRDSIGIELSQEYIDMATKRIETDGRNDPPEVAQVPGQIELFAAKD